MKTGFENLNLRPFEKRLLAVIGIAFFIVLNVWLVIPHFGDWERVQERKWTAERKLRDRSAMVQQIPELQSKVKALEGEAQAVAAEDQAIDFFNTILSEATRSGVSLPESGAKQSYKTNEFFVELTRNFKVTSREKPLVTFLYNLGASNSLIRVRDMSVRTDQARHDLFADITLVASYQKAPPKPAPRPDAKSAPAPAPKAAAARTVPSATKTEKKQ